MILRELKLHLRREPFEPFRIRLDGNVYYDIAYPGGFSLLNRDTFCFYAMRDGHWAAFPLERIVSLESLITGEF
jgi:hypothetical protein